MVRGFPRSTQNVALCLAYQRELLRLAALKEGFADASRFPNHAQWFTAGPSPPSRGRGSKHISGGGDDACGESPPSRGRGSKRHHAGRSRTRCDVASFTGAWIETWRRLTFSPATWSPPSRGRGSKLRSGRRRRPGDASPPSRGRGSKLRRGRAGQQHGRRLLHGGVDRNKWWEARSTSRIVASFTGAWIETGSDAPHHLLARVASFTGAWIETCAWPPRWATRASPPSRGRGSKLRHVGLVVAAPGRLLHGGVDRNAGEHAPAMRLDGRLLHGGVDRNSEIEAFPRAVLVASFTGAWIETSPATGAPPSTAVASFTGAWIETVICSSSVAPARVASFTGAWIETCCSRSTPT